MKHSIRLQTLAAGLFCLCGGLVSCVGPYGYYPGPNQSVGGVLGAGTGALAGAVIGNQSGRPLEGAAIGGVVGALAGSAIGNAQDQVIYGGGRHYGAAPVVYQDYAAPVIVQRRYVTTGYGWGGGWGGGWGWGGGGYCPPAPCYVPPPCW